MQLLELTHQTFRNKLKLNFKYLQNALNRKGKKNEKGKKERGTYSGKADSIKLLTKRGFIKVCLAGLFVGMYF